MSGTTAEIGSKHRNKLLSVSHLTVDYGSHRALNDFNLTLESGEVVGLVGESGSGKSTLALAMLSLLPARAKVAGGAVFFRGQDVLQLPSKRLEAIRGAGIAMIFQEPAVALHPLLTAGDQICEAVRAHRHCSRQDAVRIAHELLAEMQFSDSSRIFKAYPHELSGGQRQRVLIAQTLACGPALLIADEPTSSLDTTTQARVLTILKEIMSRHELAMLFITHDPTLLKGFAHRVVVMHQGKNVEGGPFDEVCRNPVHPYTKLLLSSIWPHPAGPRLP